MTTDWKIINENETGCYLDMSGHQVWFTDVKTARLVMLAHNDAERSEFEREIIATINRHSKENDSNTPDFILSRYVLRCMDAFTEASRSREKWFGKRLEIGNGTSIPTTRKELWDYFVDNHGVHLLESEINDILHACSKVEDHPLRETLAYIAANLPNTPCGKLAQSTLDGKPVNLT